ncbi:MAG: PASTA domain-containing protein [Gemmatimonadota bacterium]|nr:MAG: PASTA domain-containing protein [Gemmatimonadota bacterium]
MPQDFDAGSTDPSQPPEARGSWRLWTTEPRRLALTSVGVAAAGLLIGYLITVLAVFPSQSAGADLKRVPELVGRSAEEARSRVERAGLVCEEVGLHHPEALGTVVAQEPLGGQMAEPGSPVRVTVSLGSKMRPVPDVVGLSHLQAEVALERAGYESELIWVDADADVGEVVGTQPAPGTPLGLPGQVSVLVSAGPRRVRVPDLMTRSLAEAQATLDRLGLRLGEVSEDSASLAAPGTVLRQSPRAGVEVARATRVSVSVAVAPPKPLPPELRPDTTPVVPDTLRAQQDTASEGPATTPAPADTSSGG